MTTHIHTYIQNLAAAQLEEQRLQSQGYETRLVTLAAGDSRIVRIQNQPYRMHNHTAGELIQLLAVQS
ncbi:MAG: hypothetical protein ABII82_19585 [Verrucomicrobiota bacterium]